MNSVWVVRRGESGKYHHIDGMFSNEEAAYACCRYRNDRADKLRRIEYDVLVMQIRDSFGAPASREGNGS